MNLENGKKTICHLIPILSFFLQSLHNFWLTPFHLIFVSLPTSLTDFLQRSQIT